MAALPHLCGWQHAPSCGSAAHRPTWVEGCKLQYHRCLQAEKRAAEAGAQFQDLYKKATSSWTPVWLQERFGKVRSHASAGGLVSRCPAIERPCTGLSRLCFSPPASELSWSTSCLLTARWLPRRCVACVAPVAHQLQQSVSTKHPSPDGAGLGAQGCGGCTPAPSGRLGKDPGAVGQAQGVNGQPWLCVEHNYWSALQHLVCVRNMCAHDVTPISGTRPDSQNLCSLRLGVTVCCH